MLHDHTKILSAAFDLAPYSKTATFCLGFCLHPSSMGGGKLAVKASVSGIREGWGSALVGWEELNS